MLEDDGKAFFLEIIRTQVNGRPEALHVHQAHVFPAAVVHPAPDAADVAHAADFKKDLVVPGESAPPPDSRPALCSLCQNEGSQSSGFS
jgi:hypothetical protein